MEAPSEVPRDSPQRAVLVVDDEEAVRDVLGQMVEALGYPVLEASTRAEALAAFRRHGASLGAAMVDLTIAGVEPGLMLGVLQEIAPDVPVIVASGWPEREAWSRFGALEYAAYLQKPVDLETLRDALERAIRDRPNDADAV